MHYFLIGQKQLTLCFSFQTEWIRSSASEELPSLPLWYLQREQELLDYCSSNKWWVLPVRSSNSCTAFSRTTTAPCKVMTYGPVFCCQTTRMGEWKWLTSSLHSRSFSDPLQSESEEAKMQLATATSRRPPAMTSCIAQRTVKWVVNTCLGEPYIGVSIWAYRESPSQVTFGITTQRLKETGK